MTSQTIDIHQRSVLQIVKTCFNIYLTSRSKINEATAQGCLSQMLNGIFSKMEQKMVENYFSIYLFEKKIIFLGFVK
jgi:brefeldin A-inhibited guanine nucleotide-exchange protein